MQNRGRRFWFSFFSFFLGFLFALIVEIAALGGAIYYLLFGLSIDDTLGSFGIENTDEDGSKTWINTDTENGGVANLFELIQKVVEFTNGIEDRTLDDLNTILPVIDNLLLLEGSEGVVLNTIKNYGVDLAAVTYTNESGVTKNIHTVTFGEFPAFLEQVVYAVHPAEIEALTSMLNSDDATSSLILSLLMGKEADSISLSYESCPIYYDLYRKNGDVYERLSGDEDNYTVVDTLSPLADDQKVQGSVNADEEFEVTGHIDYTECFEDMGDDYYRLYYYLYDDDNNSSTARKAYVTMKGDDGNYVNLFEEGVVGSPTIGDVVEYTYADYSDCITYEPYSYYESNESASRRLTGYYYYDEDNNIVYETKVTLGYIMNNGILGSLSDIKATTLMEAFGLGVEGIFGDIIGDTTVGDLMEEDGFSSLINNISLAEFIGGAEPDNAIMSYIGYGLYNIREVSGQNYSYTAQYDIDDTTVDVYITVDADGKIDRVYRKDGNKEIEIGGTTVEGVEGIIGNVTKKLSLVSFIGGTEPDNAIMSYIGYGLYDVKAVSGENYSYTGKCDINGTPVDVYITVGSDGKINRVYRVDGTNEIDVGGTTIDGVDSLLNNVTKKLALPDLMDVKSTDGNIMTFLAFGITKDGDSYYYHLDGKTYLCDITVDSDNVILSATYTDSEGTKVVEKTKVDEVSTKINQMMDELTVKDIVDNWEASSKLLEKVGNSTINGISSIMDDIYLTDVMDVDAPTEDNTNAIMLYLSYGLTKVTATNNEGLFTATYSQYEEVTENGVTKKVFTHVTDEAYVLVKDNKISEVYYWKSVEDENGETTTEKVVIDGTKVDSISPLVSGVADNLTIGEIVTSDDPILKKLSKYNISNIQDGVKELALTDVIDIEATTKDENGEDKINAIMLYLGYGLTKVTAVDDNNYTATYLQYDEATGTFKQVTEDAKIVVENGAISEVYYYDDNGEKINIEGTAINNVSPLVNGVSDNLTIGEIVTSDDPILQKLSTYNISNIQKGVKELALSDVMDIEAPTEKDHKAVLLYIGYGITDVNVDGDNITAKYVDENNVTHDVTVDVEDGYISKVYYVEGNEEVEVYTKVSEVSRRVDGVMNELKLGEILTIESDNTVLYALRNSTISTLSIDIKKLSVQELYTSEIYGTETPYLATEYNETFLYFTLKEDGTYALVHLDGEEAGKLPTGGTIEGEYYTYGIPTGTWKFMLYDKDDGLEKAYTVNDMSKLMSNTTSNINTATLGELADAGIISGEYIYKDDDQGNKISKKLDKLPVTDPDNPDNELAKFTIEGLLRAISSLAQ